MAKFIVPKEVFHGLGTLENLKGLKGSKAVIVIGVAQFRKTDFWKELRTSCLKQTLNLLFSPV